MKILLRLFFMLFLGILILGYLLTVAMHETANTARLAEEEMVAQVTLLPTAPDDPFTHTFYLPAIALQMTPTPAPFFLPLVVQAPPPNRPAQWERMSRLDATAPLDIAALAIQSAGKLFIGDQRTDSAGGLYMASLGVPCALNQDFQRIEGALEVLDIAFAGAQGLFGAYGKRVYYTEDSGNRWLPTTTTAMNSFVFAVLLVDGQGYSGTDDGVYVSETGGQQWRKLAGGPSLINVLQARANALWIGSYAQGVWLYQDAQFVAQQRNLPTARVWDIAFYQDQIFLATAAGLYQGDGNGDWQLAGLPNQELYSLAIEGSTLFAGVRNGGVQKASLATGTPTAWQPLVAGANWRPTYSVRALLYDQTYCQGLWAATNDGVWLYHQSVATATPSITDQSVRMIDTSVHARKEQNNDATEQKGAASSLYRKR